MMPAYSPPSVTTIPFGVLALEDRANLAEAFVSVDSDEVTGGDVGYIHRTSQVVRLTSEVIKVGLILTTGPSTPIPFGRTHLVSD